VSVSEAERALLRDTVGQLLAEHCTPERVAAAAGSGMGWDAATWQALQETGLTLVGSPEERGGSGGDLSEAADIAVAAGAAAAPVPLAETLAAGMVLARAGLDIPDGPLTLAVGPAGGSGGGGSGGGGPTSGGAIRLRRVPYGRVATAVAVGTGAGGDWLCVIPAPEQVTVAGSNLAGESRDDIELGPDAAVQEVAAGLADHARRLRQLFRSLLIAGAAQRALELTITYVTEREQFGRPLGKMPVVQSELARMAGEVALISAATQAAVAATGTGPDAERGADGPGGGGTGLAAGTFSAVLAAKAQASASAGQIAAIAHQLHGAIGTTQEHRLRLTTTRLWAWRDEDSPAAECFAELGRAAAAASAPGAGGLWPWLSGT
jgi:acyl-CoA dehydrogenase